MRSCEHHEQSRTWLDERLNDSIPLGLPWPSLIAFVRLATNPRVFERPVSVSLAWRQVEEWLACPSAWIPLPTERHADVLGTLLRTTGMRASLVHDAHLAALALEHGLAVASADSDFARFAGLRWENPLSR